MMPAKPKTKPHKWVAKSILLLILIGAFFALGFLHYLEPIKAFLDSDSLSFKVGTFRFSVYLLLKALITIIILFWITGIVSAFGEGRISRLKRVKPGNRALLGKAFQILTYVLAFVIGLNVLGIDVTALAVFGGAIGIGVGFGLQKITSNFISGLILLFEQSVRSGDLIELGDGTYGYVRNIAARYTLIETFQGKEVMIPNEDFITGHVINWTYSNKKARIEITTGVSYDSDIEKARELMLEAAREHEHCLDDPAPTCFLREFADSSVNFLLYFWVEDVTEGRFGPQSDVMREIWKKFKANDISIPFPQREIIIKNLDTLIKPAKTKKS